MCFLYIILSTSLSLDLTDAILFLQGLFFVYISIIYILQVHFACVLCI